MTTEDFILSEEIRDPSRIAEILCGVRFYKNQKGQEYANVSCSFDIEVSSFYRLRENHDEQCLKPPLKEISKWEKCACEYCFVLGINGKCVIGRTWDEAMDCFDEIAAHYSLNENRRMIFYVHNLSYEFQFIRKRFGWIKVFSLSERDPIQAVTASGIEFRCSYHLSGYSLSHVGENLVKYKVRKMVGDLDYSLPRGVKTPLTEKELNYVLHDGLVVMAYIQERIEEAGGFITRLPLTKTGYVRKYCRRECLYGGKGHHEGTVNFYSRYRKIMSGMKINSAEEYAQLKRGFQGGFTHASAMHAGIIVEDVTSYDFTSSYPYCLVAFKYPLTSARLVKVGNKAEFKKYLSLYCCLFDVRFHGLREKLPFDHPLSLSKCKVEGYCVADNGRIAEAETVTTTITEQDFFVLRDFYSWDKMEIANFRIFKRGYLPTPFVKSILALYVAKTTLKGETDEASRINYMKSKEQLNSCYGMTVTDICRPEIKYDNDSGEWRTENPDVEKSLAKYNDSKNRFLYYHWGIWCTAFARRNLFSGIKSCGEDYLYADTDSIKIVNAEKHSEYITKYNENVRKRLEYAMKWHHLPFSLCEPSTKKGEKKLLGVWDFDGHYRKFKTLGAKRYLTEDNEGNFKLTVAGLSKKTAMPYLEEKAKKEAVNPFDLFENDLVVPSTASGRNIHTYLDNEISGRIKDYQGNWSDFDELSAVHLEESDYSLTLAEEYINFVLGLREENS